MRDRRHSTRPVVTCSGTPPAAGTTYIFDGFPGSWAANAICVPSGDQRGWKVCIGSKVSSWRSVPSALPCHSVPSGHSDPRNPRSIAREVQALRGQPRQIRHEHPFLHVVTHQLAARRRADEENCFPIGAGQRAYRAHLPHMSGAQAPGPSSATTPAFPASPIDSSCRRGSKQK